MLTTSFPIFDTQSPVWPESLTEFLCLVYLICNLLLIPASLKQPPFAVSPVHTFSITWSVWDEKMNGEEARNDTCDEL